MQSISEYLKFHKNINAGVNAGVRSSKTQQKIINLIQTHL